MTKRKWLFGVAALALIGIVLLIRGLWTSDGAARSQAAVQVVPVLGEITVTVGEDPVTILNAELLPRSLPVLLP